MGKRNTNISVFVVISKYTNMDEAELPERCSYVSSNIISMFVWFIGVLGNVVNLVVFSQKEMDRSPVNLIFWWLSLSDLFELFTIALYEYGCKWCFMLDSSCILLNESVTFEADLFSKVLFWGSNYLLFAFHTITVILNITLAILRFMVVRKPIENRSFSSRRSIQRLVIGLYIFSLVLSLPVLYRTTLTVREDDYANMYEYFWLQSFDIFIRLGSLAVLIISCAMFIFAVVRARRDRERTLNSEQTRETGRTMKQINKLTMIIILMFIISDIIMVVDGGAMLRYLIHYYNVTRSKNPEDSFGFERYLQAFLRFKFKIMCFQLLAFLVNCSYSIFCYLIFSSQYRKTLKLYLKNKCPCVFSKLKRENSEDIIEAYTLSTEIENNTTSL